MHEIVIRNGVVIDGTGGAPRPADVAIDGDRITEVGEVTSGGRREIDAEGLAIAPGWIDIHTHLDAQLLWDDAMVQSSAHGVTSVVMGNCGVGIAPVRPADHGWILDLLDGVEDISAAALGATLDFQWETFEEYLDVVDQGRYAFDLGAHVPHSAVRRFVMGERGGDQDAVPTGDEIAGMAAQVERGLRAGAVGFSTSRTINHRSRSNGVVIGTMSAAPDELIGLASACRDTGLGVVQLISDVYQSDDPEYVAAELDLVEALTRLGRPVSMSLLQLNSEPERYHEVLDRLDRVHAGGGNVWAQVAPRPIGGALAADASRNPLMRSASYRDVMADAPARRAGRLADADLRARVVREVQASIDAGKTPAPDFDSLFPMSDPPNYSPTVDDSVGALARAAGASPVEVLYHVAAAAPVDDAVVYTPFANFASGDLSAVRRMLTSPRALFGLSDSGAHCTTICDASFPTFALGYWSRDTDLASIPAEYVVHCQTQRQAAYLGWNDRGVVAPGYLADLNVIDLATVGVRRPRLVRDLPEGGGRYLQKADGYRATLKRGEVVFENGELTDSRPGRLVRGRQPAPV
ncbi:MAG: putative D-aminoacylase [Actinomycetia bacterium]|nr:putative D-aminoacylase [Actinomycetes bacterium]